MDLDSTLGLESVAVVSDERRDQRSAVHTANSLDGSSYKTTDAATCRCNTSTFVKVSFGTNTWAFVGKKAERFFDIFKYEIEHILLSMACFCSEFSILISY